MASITMAPSVLILDKGGRKYVFRYAPGYEGVVMEHLWQLVEDGRSELDWLDAATLSFLIVCQAALRRQEYGASATWQPIATTQTKTESKRTHEANR
jgi:hypothetical protein